MTAGYDVAVVGLGAMGSAAAYQLSVRGARVLGLEQFQPAHDRGSSHGDSRIIRQAYFEHPSYVPLVRAAYDLWAALEEESGRRLVTMTGGLMIGLPDSAVVAGSLRSARVWGLPHELLDATAIRRRFPPLTVADDEVGLYEERAGFVRPEEAVRAQLAVAARGGADLRFGERVTGWATHGASVRVATARRPEGYQAERLVLCPGAWAPGLGVPGPRLAVERQVMHWFAPTGGIAQFAADRFPIYLWQDRSGEELYGFPARDGEDEVKVAFFYRPSPCDPDAVERTVRSEEIAELAGYLRHRLPALVRHRRAVTCLYTLSPDGHFVIGPHPRHERVCVAAGFSGHGFKFAPVVGSILADLALDGRTGRDISLFDPARG